MSSAGPLPAEIATRVAAAQAQGASGHQALTWARSLGDGLGRGLDPEMIMPLAALRYIGVPTTACCAGHSREQRPGAHAFPWINFPAPIENGQFLLAALPAWTIVQRGRGAACSYRLNPKEISAIDDDRYEYYPENFWTPARQELQRLAAAILASSAEARAAAADGERSAADV